MVLPVGIEPTTSPLPRECSTTELRQRLEGPNLKSTANLGRLLGDYPAAHKGASKARPSRPWWASGANFAGLTSPDPFDGSARAAVGCWQDWYRAWTSA